MGIKHQVILRYQAHVLLSMCCQHCVATGKMVTAKDVQRWCQCSKKTALSILSDYVKSGHLEKFSQRWRSNAVQYNFRPLKSVFNDYRNGIYKDQYTNWVSYNRR